MSAKLLILPGDGIGPEIVAQATKIIDLLIQEGLALEYEYGLLGGCAYEKEGHPYPEITRQKAKRADAILLGAVGDPKYEAIERALRPEMGLLAIRSDLQLFANLRPITLFPELAEASSLKLSYVDKLDFMIVRELTGDIYFGEPRGVYPLANGEFEGVNTMRYTTTEIKRIAHVAFQIAIQRKKRLCSVDKANVLETTELWRKVFIEVSKNYPSVELTHLYVDNAAMQLVKSPTQFDVLVTGNLFGDILSDLAATLTGSIGMLASASLSSTGHGLYEPAHGSAPDIAGQNKANPLATILSLAMLFRYTLKNEQVASRIEQAVKQVLMKGYRTLDIKGENKQVVSCSHMGDLVVARMCAS
ncbi:MAG: 3-isopropylmalate dehydrogenase [Neisseriaceae bacterium]